MDIHLFNALHQCKVVSPNISFNIENIDSIYTYLKEGGYNLISSGLFKIKDKESTSMLVMVKDGVHVYIYHNGFISVGFSGKHPKDYIDQLINFMETVK